MHQTNQWVGYLAAVLALTSVVTAQDKSAAAAKPKFEVASVKSVVAMPSGAGNAVRGAGAGCPLSFKMDRGRIDLECATLTTLIAHAFRFPPDRVTGPDWMVSPGSTRFNIAAKLPQGASEDQVPEMLQALLADRFKLAIHRGITEQALYALVVAKGGLKVKEAAPDVPASIPAAPPDPADPDAPPDKIAQDGDVRTRTAPNADGSGYTTTISNSRMGMVRETGDPATIQRWEAPHTTFEGLVDLLDRVAPLSLPIIDKTGLNGRYQLVLDVSLHDVIGSAANPGVDPATRENARMEIEESILKAFNDGLRKLGLQLDRRKGPIETLIVDHVEKMPTEN